MGMSVSPSLCRRVYLIANATRDVSVASRVAFAGPLRADNNSRHCGKLISRCLSAMHHRADGERNKSNGLRDLVIMATPTRNCISSSDLPPVSPRYFTWKRHVIQNATGIRALNIIVLGDVSIRMYTASYVHVHAVRNGT